MWGARTKLYCQRTFEARNRTLLVRLFADPGTAERRNGGTPNSAGPPSTQYHGTRRRAVARLAQPGLAAVVNSAERAAACHYTDQPRPAPAPPSSLLWLVRGTAHTSHAANFTPTRHHSKSNKPGPSMTSGAAQKAAATPPRVGVRRAPERARVVRRASRVSGGAGSAVRLRGG